MGEPVPVGRACGLCGQQVTLVVETAQGTYTDDFGALMQTGPGQTIVLEAHCDCSPPRTVGLEGTTDTTRVRESECVRSTDPR